jgi:rubrerythrin
MKDFHSLSQREILALAISLEEEDERVYTDFAEGLRQDFPSSAAVFEGMRAEEGTGAGFSSCIVRSSESTFHSSPTGREGLRAAQD